MSNKDTSGPAFPRSETLYPDGRTSDPGADGISMRDYFAAKAMQGYLAHGKAYDFDDIAQVSFRVADAMIKAREY